MGGREERRAHTPSLVYSRLSSSCRCSLLAGHGRTPSIFGATLPSSSVLFVGIIRHANTPTLAVSGRVSSDFLVHSVKVLYTSFYVDEEHFLSRAFGMLFGWPVFSLPRQVADASSSSEFLASTMAATTTAASRLPCSKKWVTPTRTLAQKPAEPIRSVVSSRGSGRRSSEDSLMWTFAGRRNIQSSSRSGKERLSSWGMNGGGGR